MDGQTTHPRAEAKRAEARAAAAGALGVPEAEILSAEPMDSGMTNDSFRVETAAGTYLLRLPGTGSGALIDRRREAAVYRAIAGRGLCDDPVFLDPESGVKLTPFLHGARRCESGRAEDAARCAALLRRFHAMELEVEHSFDLFGEIERYETLRRAPSSHPDYAAVKAGVLALRPYIEAAPRRRCLTHIDAVSDNFLFCPDGAGGETLQLTDWEYAGMQDPHVDLAMFCIYSGYDRAGMDAFFDLYFAPEGGCGEAVRGKLYAYAAVCGLLWSNWCQYKAALGEDYTDYDARQYDYARSCASLARETMEKGGLRP